MMIDRDVNRLQAVHIQSCVFWDVTSCTLVVCAIAHAVCLQLPIMAAQVKSCGICGGEQHWGRFSLSTSASLANHSFH
jgi:hypothetical protein